MILIIRAVLWLSRTQLGLSVLAAVASYGALVAISVHSPQGGPLNSGVLFGLFKAGFHVGRIVFPNYGTRGTTGFYLVPLCGALAQFLLFMMMWFAAIRVVQAFRTGKQNGDAELTDSTLVP